MEGWAIIAIQDSLKDPNIPGSAVIWPEKICGNAGSYFLMLGGNLILSDSLGTKSLQGAFFLTACLFIFLYT